MTQSSGRSAEFLQSPRPEVAGPIGARMRILPVGIGGIVDAYEASLLKQQPAWHGDPFLEKGAQIEALRAVQAAQIDRSPDAANGQAVDITADLAARAGQETLQADMSLVRAREMVDRAA